MDKIVEFLAKRRFIELGEEALELVPILRTSKGAWRTLILRPSLECWDTLLSLLGQGFFAPYD
jgi:hypothetical protein